MNSVKSYKTSLNVAGTSAWTVNCHLPHTSPERYL